MSPNSSRSVVSPSITSPSTGGDDVFEDDLVRDPAAVTTQGMVGVELGPDGQQGFELDPDRVE